MTSLSASRPIVLTGFDLEITCPRCGDLQLVSDDLDGALAALGSRDVISLTATGGQYKLLFTLWCWSCGHTFSGRVAIKSRAAVIGGDPAGYGAG